MDDRNAQVGWTDAQWNRIREEVLRAWQRARVAGSFLPVYGPLPPSTQVVPSEEIQDGGTIDAAATVRIVELTTTVELNRQQVREEDLSDALLLFRRAATALGRAEDHVIFKGQDTGTSGIVAASGLFAHSDDRREITVGPRFPTITFDGGDSTIAAAKKAGVDLGTFITNARGLARAEPGAVGLVEGTQNEVQRDESVAHLLVAAIVLAISQLEGDGYGPPFVCVLGKEAFVSAHTPAAAASSLTMPVDRIEPLVGRPLLRTNSLDLPDPPARGDPWGLVLSLAGDAVDLVVAVEATPEFSLVDGEGHYVFRLFERFALRIKDPNAIVQLARS